jgi:hypothetical protein
LKCFAERVSALNLATNDNVVIARQTLGDELSRFNLGETRGRQLQFTITYENPACGRHHVGAKVQLFTPSPAFALDRLSFVNKDRKD